MKNVNIYLLLYLKCVYLVKMDGIKKVRWAKQGVVYIYSTNNSQVERVSKTQAHRRIYKKVVGLRRKIALYYYLNF